MFGNFEPKLGSVVSYQHNHNRSRQQLWIPWRCQTMLLGQSMHLSSKCRQRYDSAVTAASYDFMMLLWRLQTPVLSDGLTLCGFHDVLPEA